MSVASSLPWSVATRLVPSLKRIVIFDAPSTTWAAVTMWPSASATKPQPVAVPSDCAPWPNGSCDDALTPSDVMFTTPGDAAA